ncbi:MAG TPA: response regulator [Opitutaceae bacterium]|jgi:signal transduction histidine kinase
MKLRRKEFEVTARLPATVQPVAAPPPPPSPPAALPAPAAAAIPAPAPASAPPVPGLRILLLEDSPAHVELTEHVLRHSGLDFAFSWVDNRDDFTKELTAHAPDLILSDYSLPGFDGNAALEIAKEIAPDIPFIFVTGTLGEEVAIETLKQGATDYVLKTRLNRLVPAVKRALREAQERRERHRAEDKLRRSHEQLRALTGYLQYVREEERSRIAREVHDELGQNLTGLKLDLSFLAGRLKGTGRTLLPKIKEMSAQVDATIQNVRRIATELRPAVLDSLGLIAAIEWQANEFQSRTGIRCEVKIDLKEAIWDQNFSTVCFRIFQETLTNIIRHAQATRVDVRLAESEGQLVLTVRDNGRGISEKEIINTRSIGLIGMKERAAQVGGEVFFFGLPGRGTTVTMRVPLPSAAPPEGFRS